MVNLLTGPKGTGKTQIMIEKANEAAKNTDNYVGFIYGMYSSNHDIECIFIDGVLKHADITLETLPKFIQDLKGISKECGIDFYVSVSAEKDDVANVIGEDCCYLN